MLLSETGENFKIRAILVSVEENDDNEMKDANVDEDEVGAKCENRPFLTRLDFVELSRG